MNGSLYTNDKVYYSCLNTYKVTFKDGTTKYTRARCKFDAEENVCWINDEDRSDDIVSCEKVEY